jgi:hypothetical protein
MTIGRKTGGRTNGTPNRKTQALQAKVEAAGRVSPLDFVLGVMWDPDAPPSMRFDAAKVALPFLHPKLAAIEHSGPGRGPIETRQPLAPLVPAEVGAAVRKLLGDAEVALGLPAGSGSDAQRLNSIVTCGQPLPPDIYAALYGGGDGDG